MGVLGKVPPPRFYIECNLFFNLSNGSWTLSMQGGSTSFPFFSECSSRHGQIETLSFLFALNFKDIPSRHLSSHSKGGRRVNKKHLFVTIQVFSGSIGADP